MAGQVKIKLRKNDKVQVISGRERGKTGRIVRIDRDKGRAVVAGPQHGEEGRQAAQAEPRRAASPRSRPPLALAKLMIVCKKCGPDAHPLEDRRRAAVADLREVRGGAVSKDVARVARRGPAKAAARRTSRAKRRPRQGQPRRTRRRRGRTRPRAVRPAPAHDVRPDRRAGAARGVRLRLGDAGAAPGEDRGERRPRRGHREQEAARHGRRRSSGRSRGARPCARWRRSRIANFKVRKGNEIGVMVTLRGDVMYEFLDRLVNVAMPRIKDFRGLNPNSFDGQRQLLPRGDRADHLPRDRLRQDRADQRHEHRDRHDGAHGRGGAQPPRPHGHALPEVTGDEQAWHARQRSRRATPGRSTARAGSTGAASAAGSADSCGSSTCAASASGTSPAKEKFLASRSRAGRGGMA